MNEDKNLQPQCDKESGWAWALYIGCIAAVAYLFPLLIPCLVGLLLLLCSLYGFLGVLFMIGLAVYTFFTNVTDGPRSKRKF